MPIPNQMKTFKTRKKNETRDRDFAGDKRDEMLKRKIQLMKTCANKPDFKEKK